MTSPHPATLAPRNVVYTCVFGGYDALTQPAVIEGDTAYLCFTDNPDMPAHGWVLTSLDSAAVEAIRVAEAETADVETRLSRYAKICPHKVLAGFERSLYVDANLELIGKTEPLFSLLDDVDIAFFAHPEGRRNVYEEAEACISIGKDAPHRLRDHIARYRTIGFAGRSRDNAIAIPTGMAMLRRHSAPGVVAAMDLWWCEYTAGCRRDQISLPYALWKTSAPHRLLEMNARQNAYFSWRQHSCNAALRARKALYESADAVILHLPGADADRLSQAIGATLTAKRLRGGGWAPWRNTRKIRCPKIVFDDNQLGAFADGAPEVQVLHAEALAGKPVALLRANADTSLRRAFEAAKERGVQSADLTAFAASPIYGRARRRAFEAQVEQFLSRHDGPIAIFDEAHLADRDFDELARWLDLANVSIRANALQHALIKTQEPDER